MTTFLLLTQFVGLTALALGALTSVAIVTVLAVILSARLFAWAVERIAEARG